MKTIQDVLQETINSDSLPYDQIEQWAIENQLETLNKFIQKVMNHWNDAPKERWRFSGMLNKTLDQLAINPQVSHLTLLFDLLSNPRIQAKVDQPQMAAKLAVFQSAEMLDRVIRDYIGACLDLNAMIVHELVIRVINVLMFETFRQISTELEHRSHPLCHLPLRLLSNEEGLSSLLKTYHKNGGSAHTLPFHPQHRNEENRLNRYASDVIFNETIVPSHMSTVFESWKQHSNGEIETKSLRYNVNLNADTVVNSTLLLELGLACLEESRVSDLYVTRIHPKNVLEILFSAASHGGAYSQGLSHPYGRLKMWESVAGLMSLPADTKIEDLHAALTNYVWFSFETRSQAWYYHIAWDVGIAVYNNNRQILNILAATDTD